MKVRQLISELLQFPMDLDVTIYQDKEPRIINGVGIVIDDGRPQCAIYIKQSTTKGEQE